MNCPRPQALLFDFDGTLADTEPVHWACWRDTLAEVGIELEWEFYERNCVGLSEREFLNAIGATANPPQSADELWPLYSIKVKRFAEFVASRDIIPPKNRDLFNGLSEYLLGVVTSCIRAEVEPILKKENILPFLKVSVYGDDVARLKPAPDPYLLALERLGVETALVFEDSEAGMTSARAAGCQVVAVQRSVELPELVRHAIHFR